MSAIWPDEPRSQEILTQVCMALIIQGGFYDSYFHYNMGCIEQSISIFSSFGNNHLFLFVNYNNVPVYYFP